VVRDCVGMNGGFVGRLTLTTLLAACGVTTRAPETARADSSRTATIGRDSAADLIDARVPRAVAGDSGWRYQQRVRADLDADGEQETAVLIADVGLDGQGTPMWEDGHRWQVYVEEQDGRRTYLYARFLPNGKLLAAVADAASGTTPAIVLLEQTRFMLGAYELAYRGPAQVALLGRFQRSLDPTRHFVGSPRP
jgi:hypothetical protein